MEPRRRGSKGAHIPKLCPACTCWHPRDFHRVHPIVSVTLDNPHALRIPESEEGEGEWMARQTIRAGRLQRVPHAYTYTCDDGR